MTAKDPGHDNGDMATRLTDQTRLECRICWYVYDPTEGDEIGQIAPGTPFSDLPSHWRCPQCDADTGMFLPFDN